MQHKGNYRRYKLNSPDQTLNNKIEDARDETKLSKLRERIFAIENSIPKASPMEAGVNSRKASPWRFGLCAIDDALPWRGLGPGLHEIQPADYRDTGAAMAFALALISRLTSHDLGAKGAEDSEASRFLLLCMTSEAMREFGHPYSPGVASLGLDPTRIILVNAKCRRDAAWAMEECVKSPNLIAVVGVLPRLDLAPARRLALTAKKYGTPCLAIEAHDAPGLGPALSRWRVAGGSSSASPFDARAPGFPVWRLVLERCRHGMEQRQWSVEWRHDAHRFDLAAQFPAGAAALAPGSPKSAGRLRACVR